jgi:hypothetical protein
MGMNTARSIQYVHLVISLQEAKDHLLQRLALGGAKESWIKRVLTLLTSVALNKDDVAQGACIDGLDSAIFELEGVGFTEQSAVDLVNELFDLICTVITEAIPNFGIGRYKGKYEYTIRSSSCLQLTVHAQCFD